MRTKELVVAVALLAGGCAALEAPMQVSGEFPPPVIAGVTRFEDVAPKETPPPDTAVPPAVIAGVTRFADVAPPDVGVPDSGVPQPVTWVRFGVTREAAARETALAGNPPTPAQGKGN